MTDERSEEQEDQRMHAFMGVIYEDSSKAAEMFRESPNDLWITLFAGVVTAVVVMHTFATMWPLPMWWYAVWIAGLVAGISLGHQALKDFSMGIRAACSVLLLGIAGCVYFFIWAQAAGAYTCCQSNFYTIGSTIRVYSEDHGGRIPNNLAELTPKYLKTIPTCCATKGSEYSYQSDREHKEFTLVCTGSHFGAPPNFPQYSSLHGLASFK